MPGSGWVLKALTGSKGAGLWLDVNHFIPSAAEGEFDYLCSVSPWHSSQYSGSCSSGSSAPPIPCSVCRAMFNYHLAPPTGPGNRRRSERARVAVPRVLWRVPGRRQTQVSSAEEGCLYSETEGQCILYSVSLLTFKLCITSFCPLNSVVSDLE